MKTQSILASITLALAGSAFAAGDKHNHAHEHKPLHGGVVVEVKDMDYELVAKRLSERKQRVDKNLP